MAKVVLGIGSSHGPQLQLPAAGTGCAMGFARWQ